MSPRLHASARKYFERDRLTDEAGLYAYEHALTGPASVLVVPHVLIDPQHPHPRETGRVIRCGLQTWLDMGPHGIPRGCQLSGQASDSGSFETQLSDRLADRLGAQTPPGCAHQVVLLDKGHDPAGAFWQIQRRLYHRILVGIPAQGASITSSTIRPWPCAIQPTTRAARQLVARLNIEHQGPWGASHAH